MSPRGVGLQRLFATLPLAWMFACSAVAPVNSVVRDVGPPDSSTTAMDAIPLTSDRAETISPHFMDVATPSEARLDDVLDVGGDRRTVPHWTLPSGSPPPDPATRVVGTARMGCILTSSGSVWCWDESRRISVPTSLRGDIARIGGLPPVRDIAITTSSASAVDVDGWLWHWGDVPACRGSEVLNSAVRVASALDPVRSARGDSGLVVFSDGSCRREFANALPDPCAWEVLWAGGVHVASADLGLYCVVTTGGRLECRRSLPVSSGVDRTRFVFHDFTMASSEFPGLTDVADVALGHHSQCVLHRSGRVSCWGSGFYGETGSLVDLERCDQDPAGYPGCRRWPTEVPTIDDAVSLIGDVGDGYCVVRRDGTVWCWGRVLSRGYEFDDPDLRPCPFHPMERCLAAPARVSGLRDVIDFSQGWCAVIRDGRVYCLGSREGDAGSRRIPREVRWGE